jgi:acyl-CoA reductase-like NAD-dependent aldehyde dehydrogenase
MSVPVRPFYLAGQPTRRDETLAVAHKYTGEPLAAVSRAEPGDFERAIAAAAEAFDLTRRMAAYEREEVVRELADGIAARRADFVETLIAEAGKPRKNAEQEVDRTLATLAEAARRAVEVHGEYLALDLAPRMRGYRGHWRRFPLGPVGCITPFNFPLNLVVHKIGPAIAAGCPFVVKPASATPLSALLLGEVLSRTGWPKGAFSVLPARAEEAAPIADDERIRVLSFTGSPAVGWALKQRAGRKRVVLELGGNAAAVVHRDADLADAARRCAVGGFSHAGQSCISVQRILVDRAVYEAFKGPLIEAAAAMKVGDPTEPETDVGPMIAESEARRVGEWIAEAVADGARVLCGGRRRGALLEPAVVENVPPHHKLNRCEVFGPVVTLKPYDSFDEALAMVNDSDFGLQAGVFTRDIGRIGQAYETLNVGGVIINDAPTFRADHMPYGGAKASGTGREGVRFAIEDYTEIKMLVIRE